jgi:hypothetical protein
MCPYYLDGESTAQGAAGDLAIRLANYAVFKVRRGRNPGDPRAGLSKLSSTRTRSRARRPGSVDMLGAPPCRSTPADS